jgi:hypothetical protein
VGDTNGGIAPPLRRRDEELRMTALGASRWFHRGVWISAAG